MAKRKEPIQQDVDERVILKSVEDERVVLPTISEDLVKLDAASANQLCAGVVAPNKRSFILALAQLGNRSRAAKAVGISVVTTHLWRKEDPEFTRAYEKAMLIAAELHEDEMLRRASEGVLEPVFNQGKMVGSIRRYSDTLIIFGLKGAMPEKYRENIKVEHNGKIDMVERLRAGRERALGRRKKVDD